MSNIGTAHIQVLSWLHLQVNSFTEIVHFYHFLTPLPLLWTNTARRGTQRVLCRGEAHTALVILLSLYILGMRV